MFTICFHIIKKGSLFIAAQYTLCHCADLLKIDECLLFIFILLRGGPFLSGHSVYIYICIYMYIYIFKLAAS